MILLTLTYVFWAVLAGKKANKKQKNVTIIAVLLLGCLSFVPVTVVVEPRDDSAKVLRAPGVVFANTEYAFFVFFVSWLLVYFFRDRKNSIL